MRSDLPEQDYKKKPVIRERAQKLFADAQYRTGQGALDLFLEKVGMDTRQLVMEAEKLMLYIGDRKEITVEDVKAITSSSAEAITWDFTDALGERRLSEALKILRQLIFQGEAPIGIMFAVENLYQNLMQYRAYIDQGWLKLSSGFGANAVQWSNDPAMDKLFTQLPSDPREMHWFRTSKLGQQAASVRPARDALVPHVQAGAAGKKLQRRRVVPLPEAPAQNPRTARLQWSPSGTDS